MNLRHLKQNHKTKPVGFLLEEQLYFSLCKIAEAENRTLAAQIRHFMLIGLRAYQGEHHQEAAGA